MVRLRISYHTVTNPFRRYYGSSCPECGFFTVSINGSAPQRLTAKSNSTHVSTGTLVKYEPWSRQTHCHPHSRRHKLHVAFSLDFFRSVTAKCDDNMKYLTLPFSLPASFVVQCPPRKKCACAKLHWSTTTKRHYQRTPRSIPPIKQTESR
jgi:hypothetical protein